jgi:hypothetical protein
MRSVRLPAAVCLAVALAGTTPGSAAELAGARSPAAGPAAQTRTPAGTGDSMPAVWKERHVEFFYAGRTARYSCDGLLEKVRAMLLDLGARRDVKITPLRCADTERMHGDGGGSRIKIVFSSPAQPEAADKPLHKGDLVATDARFERFTITSDAFRNLGIGDCELVQEFTRQILPRLMVRDVRQDIVCVPYKPSVSRFFIRGEVLKSVPRAEQRAAGQSAKD